MICRVDEAQRLRLQELEEQDDRFDPEVEVGAEVAPTSSPVDVSGVPEPQEWLLLILGGIAMVLWQRRRVSWHPTS